MALVKPQLKALYFKWNHYFYEEGRFAVAEQYWRPSW